MDRSTAATPSTTACKALGMGEAKRRNDLLAQLRAETRWCIYCGGVEQGTTVDHMPPIGIFDGRQRPKGLEFLACAACNGGARADEMVAGLLGRLRLEAGSPTQQLDFQRALAAVRNNAPEILLEMRPSNRQHRHVRSDSRFPSGAMPINASGPLLNRAMNRFGAKLGLALHHRITGQIVPPSGAVRTRWYANADAITGRFPADALAFLGPPETLKQGKLTVGDQFQFASQAANDGPMSVHQATFRFSFAIVAFVSHDTADLGDTIEGQLWRPGFLRDAAARIAR
jgi:hypothetical protein